MLSLQVNVKEKQGDTLSWEDCGDLAVAAVLIQSNFGGVANALSYIQESVVFHGVFCPLNDAGF